MKFLAKPLSLILSLIFVFYCDSFLSLLHGGVDAPQTRESRVLGSAFSDPSISGNASQRQIGALLRTQTPFKWDFESRMVGSASPTETLSFAYDADGMRTAKSVNGVLTRFVLDKNRDYAQVLEERDATASVINVSYIYGDDLISQERGSSLSFYHYDGQLSTRQLTDGAAQVTDSYTYDAFGVTLASSGTTPNNYLYTGEQLDGHLGSYYNRDRYYSFSHGRFISPDVLTGSHERPISLHRYLYADANPVNRIDPSGFATGTLSEQLGVTSILHNLTHLVMRVAYAVNRAQEFYEAILFLQTVYSVITNPAQLVSLATNFFTHKDFSLKRVLHMLKNAVGTLLVGLPDVFLKLVQYRSTELLDFFKSPKASYVIYMPTPPPVKETGGIPIPNPGGFVKTGFKIGKRKVYLYFGEGRGTIFGLGWVPANERKSDKQFFRLDYHGYHGEESRRDVPGGKWPANEYHFHVPDPSQ